jgi:ATP-dependent Clp protease ATP-binding subunit ClpC
VSRDAARQALIAALLPATVEVPLPGRIPFTPRAKKVLEFAVRKALVFGHNYIGTEHFLLGLLEEEEGIGGQPPASGLQAMTPIPYFWQAGSTDAYRPSR